MHVARKHGFLVFLFSLYLTEEIVKMRCPGLHALFLSIARGNNRWDNSPNENRRWDNRGWGGNSGGGGSNNRWDNSDSGRWNREDEDPADWSKPLPRNERLEA